VRNAMLRPCQRHEQKAHCSRYKNDHLNRLHGCPSDSRQERGPISAVFQDKELSGKSPTYQTIREVGISFREVWFSFRKLIPALEWKPSRPSCASRRPVSAVDQSCAGVVLTPRRPIAHTRKNNTPRVAPNVLAAFAKIGCKRPRRSARVLSLAGNLRRRKVGNLRGGRSFPYQGTNCSTVFN
jgi:hypothetical protein